MILSISSACPSLSLLYFNFHLPQAGPLFPKMADSNMLTPLPDDGTRGPRLEIDEFCLDNEMTNLFLIALSKLQQNSLDKVDEKPNWMNFYAIAGQSCQSCRYKAGSNTFPGIHGQPTEAWNGVGDASVNGYCHHSLNTFPTWHRPYMFLFEVYHHCILLECV